MKYEVCESRTVPGEWRVESVGSDGEVYVVIFSGPDAEERARAYVAAVDTIKELRSVIADISMAVHCHAACEAYPKVQAILLRYVNQPESIRNEVD